MIGFPAEKRIWLACGVTDIRKGFDGLAAIVQLQLAEDPFSGQLFVFRGRRGDRVKLLWWDGDGLCLFAKRLERGAFVWPQAKSGRSPESRAVVDAFGRDRLATPEAHAHTAAGGVTLSLMYRHLRVHRCTRIDKIQRCKAPHHFPKISTRSSSC